MKHLSVAPLCLLTNTRQGWKGSPGKNALAYYGRNKFYDTGSRYFFWEIFVLNSGTFASSFYD